MPNVMVALPNIGSALGSTPQSLADAKMRNKLKFAGVPQTGQPISAASMAEVHHIVVTCAGHIAA